jgi:hypothetical protein
MRLFMANAYQHSDESESEDKTFYTLAALGLLVVEWNFTEALFRRLLFQFVGKKPPNGKHRDELGVADVIRGLQASAGDFASDEHCTALLHAAKYFEILREYRNHYVRSVSLISRESGYAGSLASCPRSGRLIRFTQNVGVDDLFNVTNHSEILSAYIRAIIAFHHGPSNIPGPGPWPERPPLPKKFEAARK